MPQMMPLNWIMMIMTTIILLSCIISFSFFFYLPMLPTLPSYPHKLTSMKLNWPWLW